MIRWLLCACLLFVASPCAGQPQWKPTGPITAKVLHVGDGDTITLDFTPPNTTKKLAVRLRGIDAPEKNQTCIKDGQTVQCGRLAGQELARLALSKVATCHPEGGQSYGRMVGICMVDGLDVNREMVRRGWAVSYQQYSNAYVEDAKAARSAKRGLWDTEFQRPQCFRKPSSKGCPCSYPECIPQ
ncbi:thermonuclease family protein [Ferrovibrio sp.]|uniref:thermonuclease family protein n=1 Tax=Ferrovibrio sp. TaxID=1917215 RepID=UPI0035B00012